MLREHEVPSEAAMRLDSTSARSAIGHALEELGRRQHLQRAGDQVSVGNAITSMRTISAFDWDEVLRGTSVVEERLLRDPAGAYAASNDETRDRCRHAVERIARRAARTEADVADARAGAREPPRPAQPEADRRARTSATT